MKKIFYLLLLMVLFVPVAVFAKDGKADMTRLNEALASEGISAKNGSYTGKGNKVKVYIFRGQGCGYCKNLITYLNSIIDQYGDMIDINTYEVWYDSDNANLMTSVASVMGDTVGGVPYMVIGDKSFKGYSSNSNSSITKQIKKMYESNNPYDVMNHLGEAKDTTSNNTDTDTNHGDGNAYNNDLKTTSRDQEKTVNVGEIVGWTIGTLAVVAGIAYIIVSKYKMQEPKKSKKRK